MFLLFLRRDEVSGDIVCVKLERPEQNQDKPLIPDPIESVSTKKAAEQM